MESWRNVYYWQGHNALDSGIMKGITGIIKTFLWSMCECWQCTGSIYEACFLLPDVQCLNCPQMTLATLLLWRQTSLFPLLYTANPLIQCMLLHQSEHSHPCLAFLSVCLSVWMSVCLNICLSCPRSLFSPVRFPGPSLPCWRRQF